MVFRHSPTPLGDRKQSWVSSFLRQKWTWSQIMINSFTPLLPRYILDPFFSRHISSEHSDTKMSFFRHKSGENQLCSRPVSVSATHSREICEPVLPALFHNGHKRTFKCSYRWNHELKVQTYIKQISCDTKSKICFNPFTPRYNTSDEAEGWWFLTVSMGDVTPPT